MKLTISIGIAVVALYCGVATAQEQSRPLVQVRLQSLDAWSYTAQRVASVIGANTNSGDLLTALIGSPAFAGIDRQRPWGVAVSSGDRQFAILYIPVTDFATFKNGLLPSSPLTRGGGSANQVFQLGEFAVALSRRLPTNPPELSVEEKQKAMAWAPPIAVTGPPLLQVAVQIDEITRQQILQGLSAGRTAVTQGLGSQPLPPGALPAPPQAAVRTIGQYFDVIQTVAKELDRMEIQGDVSDLAILLSNKVYGLPGSDLAKSFVPSNIGISDLAGQLDTKAAASMAVALGADPVGKQALKRLFEMNLQAQGASLDEKAMSQYSRLIESLVPMRVVGSMDFGKGFLYSGIYEFPGQDVKQVYISIMEALTNILPAMTGTDKPYSSVEFKEGFRTVGEVPLSRFTAGLNLDSSALQTPGVKEILNLMLGGDKMEMEYAVKEGRLYMGSPDKMTETLGQTTPPAATTPSGITGNTVFLARANLLMLMKQALALTPSLALPTDLGAKLDRMKTEGADLRLRIELDGQLSGHLEVPLKLLERIRELQP